MSRFEDPSNWKTPGGQFHDPGARAYTALKFLAIIIAELVNFTLHLSTYSLANPIGNDLFLVDVLGLPPWELIENLTVATLINAVLAVVAVSVPVVGWYYLISDTRILEDSANFFSSLLNKVIALFLLGMYGLVVLTELSVLILRIMEETKSLNGVIPAFAAEPVALFPMLVISLALVAANVAIGLATARLYQSISH